MAISLGRREYHQQFVYLDDFWPRFLQLVIVGRKTSSLKYNDIYIDSKTIQREQMSSASFLLTSYTLQVKSSGVRQS